MRRLFNPQRKKKTNKQYKIDDDLTSKLHHFIQRQEDLDPEFNNIINEHFDELLSDKPRKKRF